MPQRLSRWGIVVKSAVRRRVLFDGVALFPRPRNVRDGNGGERSNLPDDGRAVYAGPSVVDAPVANARQAAPRTLFILLLVGIIMAVTAVFDVWLFSLTPDTGVRFSCQAVVPLRMSVFCPCSRLSVPAFGESPSTTIRYGQCLGEKLILRSTGVYGSVKQRLHNDYGLSSLV